MNRTVNTRSHTVARRNARSDEDPLIAMCTQCNVTQLTFRRALHAPHLAKVDLTLTRPEAFCEKIARSHSFSPDLGPVRSLWQ
jgi:hypothetical protein